MEAHTQQLASLSLTDDDGKRDWASLPLDILKVCLSAPQLKASNTAKRAALATCKALGRAVVLTATQSLALEADRRAPPFRRSTRIWAELWGDEQPQQGQSVVLLLLSRSQGSPERFFSKLLSAPTQRLAFVNELYLNVSDACIMPCTTQCGHRALAVTAAMAMTPCVLGFTSGTRTASRIRCA